MTFGIIPAAGKATRIGGLPKFLLPVPGGFMLERMLKRIEVPCFIGARPEHGSLMNAYIRPVDMVYQADTRSMPETILAARAYTGDANVLMGMPDTCWTDETVFQRLADYLDEGHICVVSAWLVSADMASRLGVCTPVLTHDRHTVFLDSIQDKQPQSHKQWIWGAMAWTPEFWQYIYPDDAHMGIALNRILDEGEPVPLHFASGDYYDNGTPEDYFRCIRELTEDRHATC